MWKAGGGLQKGCSSQAAGEAAGSLWLLPLHSCTGGSPRGWAGASGGQRWVLARDTGAHSAPRAGRALTLTLTLTLGAGTAVGNNGNAAQSNSRPVQEHRQLPARHNAAFVLRLQVQGQLPVLHCHRRDMDRDPQSPPGHRPGRGGSSAPAQPPGPPHPQGQCAHALRASSAALTPTHTCQRTPASPTTRSCTSLRIPSPL